MTMRCKIVSVSWSHACARNAAYLCQKASLEGKQMRALSPMLDLRDTKGSVPHMPSSAATACAVLFLQKVATPA